MHCFGRYCLFVIEPALEDAGGSETESEDDLGLILRPKELVHVVMV